jgi:hypothetical protein
MIMHLTRLLKLSLALAIAALTGLAVVSSWAQDNVPNDLLLPPPTADAPNGFFPPAAGNPGSGEGPRPGDLYVPADDGSPFNRSLRQYRAALDLQPPAEDLSALLRQLQAAEAEEERSALETKLSETLGRQFDARQKRHEQQISQLEAQLKKLRDLVNKRQANRSQIISLRLEQMLRETQGLGW